MQRKFLSLAAMCAVALAVPAWAHHSHNAYEVTKWTNMEGTVKEIHLILPHSWVYLDVKDEKAETITWALEAAGPNTMIRNGAKREDVQVGDRIKVRCHLLRDGSNGCLLGFVTPDHGDKARGHGVEIHWDQEEPLVFGLQSIRADLWPLNPTGDLIAIMMIETAEGVRNVNEIAAVPGVVGFYIGPSDLSNSLGVAPGSPETEAAIQTILKVCLAHKVPCA